MSFLVLTAYHTQYTTQSILSPNLKFTPFFFLFYNYSMEMASDSLLRVKMRLWIELFTSYSICSCSWFWFFLVSFSILLYISYLLNSNRNVFLFFLVSFSILLYISYLLNSNRNVFLYHSKENTTNQNAEKPLYIRRYDIQPSHHVLRVCYIDCVGWLLHFLFKQ